MKNYVVGFAKDINSECVVLIEKNRPKWQKGKLNGVGGHIESGETPFDAMNREFNEEAGGFVSEDAWRLFFVLEEMDSKWIVWFFVAEIDIKFISQQTDEKLVIVDRYDLPSNVIDNLYWLIPMAFAKSSISGRGKEKRDG